MKLHDLLVEYKGTNILAVIERPFVNPSMFKSTLSAIRALEATLVILEHIGIPIRYIDSKEWQKELLPEGTKGTTELKKASLDIASRMFPTHIDTIKKQKDGDGILIAEYARLKNL